MIDMSKAGPQHPTIAVELALLLALATLWGASYTFIKLGGGDDSAGDPDRGAHADRRAAAARRSCAGAGSRLPTDAATWRRFLFQACLNSVIPWTHAGLGRAFAGCRRRDHPQFDGADLHVLPDARRHPPRGGDVAKAVRRLRRDGRHLPDRRRAGAGGLGEQLAAQIVAVLAAVCYAGAAIFGRGFKGLDPMAPAAGSLLCGAAILIPLEPRGGPALDAGAVDEFAAGAAWRWRCSPPRWPS